jgi:hypothetical protein
MAHDRSLETGGKMFGILDLADNLVLYYFVFAIAVGENAALVGKQVVQPQRSFAAAATAASAAKETA